MTEKLTYDPTPADAPEFSEDEQDSLAVAEKLGQQESELYAGKYQSAEELEEAYINLQKKLGTSDDDDEVEDTYLDEDEYPEEVADGVDLITTASEEYFENDGAISEETMQRFGLRSIMLTSIDQCYFFEWLMPVLNVKNAILMHVMIY